MDHLGSGSVYESGWQNRNIPHEDTAGGYHHQPSSSTGAATGNAAFQIQVDDVRHIMSMGFTDDQAREALMEMNGNLEFAVNYLIGLGDEIPQPPPSAQPAHVAPQPPPSSYNNSNFSSNMQDYGVHGRQQQPHRPPQQPPLRDFSPHISGIQDYGAPPQQQPLSSRVEPPFQQLRLEPLPRVQHRGRSSEATAEVSRNLAQQYREMFSSSDDLDDIPNERGAGFSSGPSYSGGQQPLPAMHAEPIPNAYSNAPSMDLPTPRSNTGNNPLMNEYKAFVTGSDGQTPQLGTRNPDSIPVMPERHQQGRSHEHELPTTGRYERAASPHGARGRVRDIRNEMEHVEHHQGGNEHEFQTTNNRYERTASPHGVRGRVRDIRNELEVLSTAGTTTQNTSNSMTLASPELHGNPGMIASNDRSSQGSRGRALPTGRYDRGASPHGVRNRVMDMRNNNSNVSDPIHNNNYQPTGHSEIQSSGGPPDNYGSMPLSPGSTFSTNDRSNQGSRGRALPTGRYDRDRSASPHGVRNRVMDKRHGGSEPVKTNASAFGATELQASEMDNIGSFPTGKQQQSGDSSRGRGREKEKTDKPKKPKKERRSASPGKFLKNMIARKKEKEDDERSSDSFEKKPIKKSSSWGALSKLTKKKKNKSLEEGTTPDEPFGTMGNANRQYDDATSAAIAGDATVVSMPEPGQQRGNLRKTNSRHKKAPGRTKSNDSDQIDAINAILAGDPVTDNNMTNPVPTPASSGRRQRQKAGPKSKTKSMPSNSGWQNPLSAGPPSRPTRTTTEPIEVPRTGSYPNPGSSSISPPSLASSTSAGYQGARRTPGSGESPPLGPEFPNNDTDDTYFGSTRNRPACDYRFPDPIESNEVSPTTTTKQRKGLISITNSPEYVQPKKSPTLIEISPGMKVPLIDVETTKRAIEKRMIGQQTCIDCQSVVNCVDVADFVICPHCQVVSPRQSPRRRQVKMNNGARVALGFTGELEY